MNIIPASTLGRVAMAVAGAGAVGGGLAIAAAVNHVGPFAYDADDVRDAARATTWNAPDANKVFDAAQATGRPARDQVDLINIAGRANGVTRHSRADFQAMISYVQLGAESKLSTRDVDTLFRAADVDIYSTAPNAELVHDYLDGSRFSLGEYAHLLAVARHADELGQAIDIVKVMRAAEASTSSAADIERDLKLGKLPKE